jgi:hypothetical protein
MDDEQLKSTALAVYAVLSVVSAGALAVHGYRRHRGSAAWGAVWGVYGLVVPILPSAQATKQGWFKRK